MKTKVLPIWKMGVLNHLEDYKYFISVLLVFLSPLSAYATQDLSENFIDKSNKIEDPQSEEEKDSNLDPPRITYEVAKEGLEGMEARVMKGILSLREDVVSIKKDVDIIKAKFILDEDDRSRPELVHYLCCRAIPFDKNLNHHKNCNECCDKFWKCMHTFVFPIAAISGQSVDYTVDLKCKDTSSQWLCKWREPVGIFTIFVSCIELCYRSRKNYTYPHWKKLR